MLTLDQVNELEAKARKLVDISALALPSKMILELCEVWKMQLPIIHRHNYAIELAVRALKEHENE